MDPGFAESGSNGSSGGIGLRPVGGGQVGGSAPEIRLLMKMVAARGLSGRRGNRLPPWSEGDRSGQRAQGPFAGEGGRGPCFVRDLVERELDLPKGAGLGTFAVGRMAGWIAHLFEQRQSGKIIRPRAAVAG